MGAFATGFETGLRQSEAGQQEKQAREDLLFQTKVQDLASTRNALQAKYAATLDKEGKPTEATQGILDQLQQNAGDIRELFHPDKNPGAIERFGHLLTDALHITKPAPKITTEVGAITIPAGGQMGSTPAVSTNPDIAAVAQKFPRYAPYLSNVVVQPTQKQTDDRQVEFYPPWESENPNPGKLTVQPYRSELASGQGLTSTVSGELLHYIGGVNPATGAPIDPEYQKLKQAVAAARTPQQMAQDKAIYEDQVRNHGEKRPFDQWFNQSRLDEYIMGYVTPDAADEWRKNGWYNAPQMAKAVEAVKQYLATPPQTSGAAPSIAASSQAISLPGQKVTITEVPQKQYDKQQALQAKNLAADREAAQQAAAGAPIGPLQEAIIQADADTTKWLSLYHAKVDELRKADPSMSQEDAQRSALELMGVRLTSSLKPPMMLKLADGTETMAQQDPNGVWRYPDQEEIPLDLLKGAQMMPKAGQHMTNADEQRAAYRVSHKIPADAPWTWEDEIGMKKDLATANPLAFQRLGISEQNLQLRKLEDNFKDYVTTEKQLAPLDRIVSTAQSAEDDVKNPSGPGDVALTLAFFDAIKTTGIRFTKTEQDFIIRSRSLMDGAQAAIDKGYMGTLFAPDQRKIVADIVTKAAGLASRQKQGIVGATKAFKPEVAKQIENQQQAGQPQIQVGQPVKLKNGQTIIVKHVYPDGSFD